MGTRPAGWKTEARVIALCEQLEAWVAVGHTMAELDPAPLDRLRDLLVAQDVVVSPGFVASPGRVEQSVVLLADWVDAAVEWRIGLDAVRTRGGETVAALEAAGIRACQARRELNNQLASLRDDLGTRVPPAPWIVPGAIADYHAVAGGPVTRCALRVRTQPHAASGHWSVFVGGIDSAVCCSALTPAHAETGRG